MKLKYAIYRYRARVEGRCVLDWRISTPDPAIEDKWTTVHLFGCELCGGELEPYDDRLDLKGRMFCTKCQTRPDQCSVCGVAIPDDLADLSRVRFNLPLCRSHYSARRRT